MIANAPSLATSPSAARLSSGNSSPLCDPAAVVFEVKKKEQKNEPAGRTYQVIEQVFPVRAHLQSLGDPFSAECNDALNCPLPPRKREEEGQNI